MIQWNCAGRPPADNELFKIVDAGAGRVRFQVKNSGVCLEDPGRGGIIRQNVCSPRTGARSFPCGVSFLSLQFVPIF